MNSDPATLPNDIETLKAAWIAARAEVAVALAERSSNQALIAHLKLEIAKLNRDRFGPRSERTARLLDQMELQLEELVAQATADELAAEQAGAASVVLMALFERLRAHVMAAGRLHGDDTTVPVLARGKTDIALTWGIRS